MSKEKLTTKIKEFKGTKGELTIENIAKVLPTNIISKDKQICTFVHSNESFETIEANAKLIAAAPDLLEALNKIVEINGTADNNLIALDRALNEVGIIAEAAINKALK